MKLELRDLEVEALRFAAGDEQLESMTIGQGINEVGASVSYYCCTSVEID